MPRLILSQKNSAAVLTPKILPVIVYRERALVICSSGGITTSIGTEYPAASPVIMSQRVIKAVSKDKNKVKEKVLEGRSKENVGNVWTYPLKYSKTKKKKINKILVQGVDLQKSFFKSILVLNYILLVESYMQFMLLFLETPCLCK